MDINKYPNLFRFSRATLFRHAKKPLDEDMHGVRHQNRGRPCLTIKRDLRVIKRQSNVMREGSRSFSVVELQRGCGMSSRMSAITFRRALNSLGYNYRNTRRKEMLLKRTYKRDVLGVERHFDTSCYHIIFGMLDFACIWMAFDLSTIQPIWVCKMFKEERVEDHSGGSSFWLHG